MHQHGAGPGVGTRAGSGGSAARRPRSRTALEREAQRAEVAELKQDLREPLATITALASAGQHLPGISDDARSLFADIAAQAREAAARCRELPAGPTEEARFSLDELTERAAGRAHARYGADVAVDSRPVTVEGSPAPWRALVDRLLADACLAAGSTGSVEVTVRAEEGEVVLSVEDSGSAYRSDQPLSTAGLETAQQIAEHHGGRVSVGHSHLGGASVRVAVPLGG